MPRGSDLCRKRKMVRRGSTIPNCSWLDLSGDQLHLFQRLRVGCAQNAALGNDCGHVFGWSHVESGIADADTVRSELFAAVMGHFDCGALFDGNGLAAGCGSVDGGPGGGAVEGDAMF